MKHKKYLIFWAMVFVVALFATCTGTQSGEEVAVVPDKIDFNYHVKPILSDKCFKCHGPDPNHREAGFRLDTEEGAFKALEDNPEAFAIVKGNVEKSDLVSRVFSDDPTYMMPPPDSHLSLTDYEKIVLRKWITQGAPYKKHWAFIPPERSPVPKVKNDAWPANEIDYFVLAKMEEKGFKPSPKADKERLIRRLAFDLTGLPPTLELADWFLANESPNAYEQLVDTLLASSDYGERMAAYWLDIARYGDSHGYQDDLPRTMWPWRDWVIRAFNENMPYDRFVTWQLAGDLLPNANREQILASAFNRNHKISQEGGIIDEEYRVEYVLDRVNTFGKAFLAASFECSRCHDHKYDPYLQKEYFEVSDFFNRVPETGFVMNLTTPKPFMKITKEDLNGVLSFLNAKNELKDEDDTIEQMVMQDVPGIRKTYVLDRGEYDKHGAEVSAGTPESIMPFDTTKFAPDRLGLAKWLFDPNNPLPARVMMNRLWQELFGKGLVETAEDFGNQGKLPTHPELLDWLAVEFRESGWDMKKMLKEMAMTATYRQSSVVDERIRERDPSNEWLARGSRYRLNAEMIRDNLLATSGLLDREIGGPSVKPYQPPGLWEAVSVGAGLIRGESTYVVDTLDGLYRRSLYTYWRKTMPPPSMLTFDEPARELCEVRRTRTSTPLQALTLMNDPQVLEAARVLAYKIVAKPGLTDEERVAEAFRTILIRYPGEVEKKTLEDYYEDQLEIFNKDKKSAEKLLNVGYYPQNRQLDQAKCAAMMQVITTIYNLDETISKS